MTNLDSVYYPYERIYSYTTLPDGERILKKVVDYLLDLPDAVYQPRDNNLNPRVRLIKYLYYDDPLPLQKPLPTPEQKKSIVYDPYKPDRPSDIAKGYRLFSQALVSQAQTDGQTILRIYFGRVLPRSVYQNEFSLRFVCLSNVSMESNTRSTALSRTFAMCQAIIEALSGVNITGVGTFYMDRRQHPDCGIEPINDESTNIGYLLTMALTVMGGEGQEGI